MSKLSFRSSTETPSPTPTVEHKATTHHILLEATVRPVGANDFKQERVSAQADALRAFRREGRDLFEMNETRKIQSAGTLLYQTTETYGTPVSIESICETMQASDLTLRVNFKRPGVHSSTTCMELSKDTLQKMSSLPRMVTVTRPQSYVLPPNAPPTYRATAPCMSPFRKRARSII